MANTLNNIKDAAGVLAEAAAGSVSDSLAFTKSISKADPKDFDGKNGYKAGDTIYLSKNARFIPGSSFDITSSIQDVSEEKTPLPLDIISTIGISLDTNEMATKLGLKSIIERVIKPAASSIAHDVELRMLQKATQATFNLVGTAGSTTFDVDTVLSAREKMSKFLAPKDDARFVLFDSTAGRSAVNARKSLFQSAADIAKQYKLGYVGQADGFNWLENELLYTHTRGTATGAHTVTTTVSVEGATTLNITGTGSQTLKKGDVFTIAGVKAVHPITKVAYPFDQQFVVTADATASSGAYTSVGISPGIYTSASKGLQTVNAFPAATNAITLIGAASTAYTQNLAFHEQAFKMVSVPLEMPNNAEFAEQRTVNGVTIAIVRDWDQLKRRMVTRLDFLGGLAVERPEFASRITG